MKSKKRFGKKPPKNIKKVKQDKTQNSLNETSE